MAGQSSLHAFVGDWELEAEFPSVPQPGIPGRVAFEWMPGERFLIQRWEVDHPDAPDGLAIIETTEDGFRQHYFDTRGVARVYEMSFADGVWRLWRDGEDFSQRFTGTLSADGQTIAGAWEIAHDGSTWEHDFDITFTKVA
jgi:hypothetical protein